MKNFLEKGKKILLEPQSSIFSAALVIMMMVVLSQVLGVIRQRVLLALFTPDQYALFIAAFRMPDLIFEVLAFGAFSAAFIPVFTKVYEKDEKEGWDVAVRVLNIGTLFFATVAIIFSLFTDYFYRIFAPGFSPSEIQEVARISRFLFAAQGFFVVSFVMTGVLESLGHFLVPAIAPILYNVGIITSTLLLYPSLGLNAPAAGVLIGAFLHFLVQLPLALRRGFRFSWKIYPNRSVLKVGKLALPRIFELSVIQVQKTVELTFASLISTSSLTYLYLANSLQVVPITLFGVSLAKAALPALTRISDDKEKFLKTLIATLNLMTFVIIPIAAIFIVLRIPIVRLVYGTNIFNWESTIETGLVLSAFAIGIPIQAALSLINRAYYALHDTKTPVIVSIFDVVLTIILQAIFILVFHFSVWSIALANTIAAFIQLIILYFKLTRSLSDGKLELLASIGKSIVAATLSGTFMFFFLKLFDRSVWVKRLSFINAIDANRTIEFERFVLDTRYTVNLFILTAITALLGLSIYIAASYLMKSKELTKLIAVIRARAFKTPKDTETITPVQP